MPEVSIAAVESRRVNVAHDQSSSRHRTTNVVDRGNPHVVRDPVRKRCSLCSYSGEVEAVVSGLRVLLTAQLGEIGAALGRESFVVHQLDVEKVEPLLV